MKILIGFIVTLYFIEGCMAKLIHNSFKTHNSAVLNKIN
jgi:hypothetical protein